MHPAPHGLYGANFGLIQRSAGPIAVQCCFSTRNAGADQFADFFLYRALQTDRRAGWGLGPPDVPRLPVFRMCTFTIIDGNSMTFDRVT